MSYDFSNLYRTETITIDLPNGHAPLEVVVREIPHGEYAAIQKEFIGDFQMTSTRADANRQMSQKRIDLTGFMDRRALAAIVSWTLTDAGGDPVPVGLAAWHALPHWMTDEIEKGIQRLNPDVEDEFPGDAGGDGATEGQS